MNEDRIAARRALREVVSDLVRAIEFERDEGVEDVEADPKLLGGLRPPPTVARPRVSPSGAREMLTARDAESRLAAIAEEVAVCRRCPLHRTRTRTVPGQGHPCPELMFVGEGPGYEEDRQGLAFVGPAGQLLTRLIRRMGFSREEVFIANIVKCRPTEGGEGRRDRPPSDEEMRACLPYLERQLELLRPNVLVCLGGTAVAGLLGLKGITRLRGTWHEYRGIPVMPTYHPSYLLRSGGDEKARYWEVWSDMCQVLERLGRPVPDVRRGPPTP